MKKYNKPTFQIIKVKVEEFITLSINSQGNNDNTVGIWELPMNWDLEQSQPARANSEL